MVIIDLSSAVSARPVSTSGLQDWDLSKVLGGLIKKRGGIPKIENVKKKLWTCWGYIIHEAFHADTQSTLDGIKDLMSEIRNMDAYMATYADDEQYPVCRLELGLRKFGSCVEAINSANKPAGYGALAGDDGRYH